MEKLFTGKCLWSLQYVVNVCMYKITSKRPNWKTSNSQTKVRGKKKAGGK